MMNRRNFIASVTATIPMLSIPNYAPAAFKDETTILRERILLSFPEMIIEPDQKKLMSFHITTRNTEDQNIRMCIENVVTDVTEHYDLDELFSRYGVFHIETIPGNNICNFIRAGNYVARATRRGVGRNYAVFPDHILVWYGNTTVYDNPLIRAGNNVCKLPNYKDYFVRLDNIGLTDEDHARLKELNYRRIS